MLSTDAWDTPSMLTSGFVAAKGVHVLRHEETSAHLEPFSIQSLVKIGQTSEDLLNFGG
ncbi:MAG TPA: hypothetical protein VF821_06635 [Lentzea sp.]